MILPVVSWVHGVPSNANNPKPFFIIIMFLQMHSVWQCGLVDRYNLICLCIRNNLIILLSTHVIGCTQQFVVTFSFIHVINFVKA